MKSWIIRAAQIAATLLALSSQAQAENLYGTWQGEYYDIYISGENIYGSVGNVRSDFYVREENIYGVISGSRFDVYVRESNIYGQMPCGSIDYYWHDRNVYGNYCGDHFDTYYDNEQQAYDVYGDIVASEIVNSFPSPIKSRIRQVILEELTQI